MTAREIVIIPNIEWVNDTVLLVLTHSQLLYANIMINATIDNRVENSITEIWTKYQNAVEIYSL